MPRIAATSILWTEARALTPDARPQLVFIGDFARAEDAALEANVFGASRMQLAARVFRHVRISPADAARDAKLAGYRADTPILLVVTPDATRAFALKGAELTAVEAIDKMTIVTANVSTDDLPTIVATAERTQVAIAAVDDEMRTITRTPMTDADRQAAYAAAAARRDALVTEFRSHFVLHARTLART